jgi:2,3-bisphosphoglycerate-independent phosphoglycerate mutase
MNEGKLADIAPTILKMMGLAIPMEMTGNVIIEP